jgi:L-alanine-DL-glutamate epimerase-like enolase superfamily enzyme
MNRRMFLSAAASGGIAATLLRGAIPDYERPLFELHKVSPAPVKVKSIEVLKNGKNYFVRSTSTDGAQGITIAKDPIEILLPILQKRVIPFFTGKDARDLETLIDGVYQANYKLAGQALWLPVASVEQSLLDMLGRIAKKPVSVLLGGQLKKQVPVYLSG